MTCSLAVSMSGSDTRRSVSSRTARREVLHAGTARRQIVVRGWRRIILAVCTNEDSGFLKILQRRFPGMAAPPSEENRWHAGIWQESMPARVQSRRITAWHTFGRWSPVANRTNQSCRQNFSSCFASGYLPKRRSALKHKRRSGSTNTGRVSTIELL